MQKFRLRQSLLEIIEATGIREIWGAHVALTVYQ
jgi:hypothetical protein